MPPIVEEVRSKHIYTAEELLSMESTEIPCLVEPIIPSVGIAVVGGSSDTGKSSFLRQLASSICTGKDTFLDFKLNVQHRRVIYLSTEDDANAVSIALKKQNIENLSPELYRGLRFCFDNGEDPVATLKDMLREEPADCVIVDAYSDVFDDSNMNSTAESRAFLHKFHLLSTTFKCAVIFLHHISKAKESSGPSKNNLIGSQALEAKARVVFELRRDMSNSDMRHLCIVKGNYLEEQYKDSSYVLEFANTVFTNTSKRVGFSSLTGYNPDNTSRSAAIKMAYELKQQNFSNPKIAEVIVSEIGYKVAASTVRDWVKDVPRADGE